MKHFAAMVATLALSAAAPAQAQTKAVPSTSPALNDARMVAPALGKYAQGALADLWKRPGLAPRDRSIVTLAALIARNQTIELAYYLNLALDNGVKPREISEIITHLAFYTGWSNVMSSAAVAKNVFAARKIGADQLPASSPPPLPIDEPGKRNASNASERNSARSRPGLCRTRPTCCSAICGCVPISRRAIAASSRSAP